MLNLLKSDYYLIKKRYWILISILLGAALPSIVYFSNALFHILPASDFSAFIQNYTVVNYFASLVSSISTFAIFVISVLTFRSCLTNRTIINTIGSGYTRDQIYFSKFLLTLFLSFAVLILILASFVITNQLLMPVALSAYWPIFSQAFLINGPAVWLFTIAFLTAFLFMFRSEYGIIGIFFGTPMVIGFLLSTLSYFFPNLSVIVPFSFTSLHVTNQQFIFNTTNDPFPIIHGIDCTIPLALLYAALFTVVGYLSFQRKEIK